MKKALICLALLMSLIASSAYAKQFALVVGINDYKHLHPRPQPMGKLTDLEGATNDAMVIADALRAIGVDLPDSRLLIDEKATLDNFLKGWKALIKEAVPGDNIIITFSGHGGREKEVAEPFDETKDQHDETIMFHDFDPKNPRQGRLNDDQLRQLLAAASQFNITMVMDSCHSAGLTRSVKRPTYLSRNGGRWKISVKPVKNEIKPTVGDSDSQLPHVTQILATASELLLVYETQFDGKAHGALSWYFAEAIKGAADANKDGMVSRKEIASYLDTRVLAHMNQTQQPRILPRGGNDASISIASVTQPLNVALKPDIANLSSTDSQPVIDPDPKPQKFIKLRVKAPKDFPGYLDTTQVERVTSNPNLLIEKSGNGWQVFNHTGDKIRFLPDAEVDIIGQIVARALLLRDVIAMLNPKLPAAKMELKQGASLHKVGKLINFKFVPPDNDHRALTLFNLAGDGTLQFLYPTLAGDSKTIPLSGFPLDLKVSKPTGSDQLVGIFCKKSADKLHELLKLYDQGWPPTGDDIKQALQGQSCQPGVVGLFTED